MSQCFCFVQSVTKEGDLAGSWIFRNAVRSRDVYSEVAYGKRPWISQGQGPTLPLNVEGTGAAAQPGWISPQPCVITSKISHSQHHSCTTWDMIQNMHFTVTCNRQKEGGRSCAIQQSCPVYSILGSPGGGGRVPSRGDSAIVVSPPLGRSERGQLWPGEDTGWVPDTKLRLMARFND